MARLLVAELGADVNAVDIDRWTPLHEAAENGHVEMARLLVAELGAEVNTRDHQSVDAATRSSFERTR